jgi:hypothetical protein
MRLTAEFAKVTKNAAHKIPGELTQPSVLLARAQEKTPSAAPMTPGKATSFASATVKNSAARITVTTGRTIHCALAIHHCTVAQTRPDASMCAATLERMMVSAAQVRYGLTTRTVRA